MPEMGTLFPNFFLGDLAECCAFAGGIGSCLPFPVRAEVGALLLSLALVKATLGIALEAAAVDMGRRDEEQVTGCPGSGRLYIHLLRFLYPLFPRY